MSFLTIEHHRRSCRRPRQRRRKFLLTALLFLLPASLLVGYFAFDRYHSRVEAAAGITSQMTYQGKIIDSSDNPVADGNYGFLFQIYDASSGGSVLWTESWTSTTTPGAVAINNGVFSAPLGTSTALTDINFNSDSLYLEIRFDADSNGSFEEVFTPRKRLTASPYSFNSARLGGYVSSDFLSTTTFSASGIGSIGSSSATTTAQGNFAVAETLKVGTLTGFLKGLGGYVTTALVNLTTDITGTLGIGNGGTGTSTPGIWGQVLTWNGSNYQGTSTSTLGIAISDTTGTLSIARGGTNAITQATNGVNYFDGTSITSGSALVFDGTKFGVGTSTPAFNLSVEGVSSLGSQAIMGYLVATSTNATSTIAGDLEIAEGNNLRVSNILGYSPINIQTDIKVAGYASTTGGLFTSGNMRVTGTSIFDGLISGTGYDLAASTTFHTLLAARKGQAGWVASLGADGKVPTSQLSPLVITDTHVVSSEAAMLALAAQTGDVAIRTDENKSYILQGNDPTVLSDWTELQTPTDAVLSVNGQRGTVTLTTSHITEGSNLYFTDTRVDTRISQLKGAANGLAPLGANGKVPSSYLDMLTVNNTYVVGASTSLATLTGAVKGDVGVSTTTNKSFILAEDDPTVLSNWVELLTSPSVASVNGFTGSVTLDTDDVAEGGTNYYWTQTRFDSALLGATTWGGDLFVDTGRVGINIDPAGTTQALEIVGNASTSGSIYAKNLYVGLTGDSTSDVIYFDRSSGGAGQQSLLWSETNSRFEVSANTYFSGYASTTGGLFTQGNLHVTGNSTTTGDFAVDETFYVRSGRVSVGTTTPFGLLSVNAPAGLPSLVVGSSTATNFIVTAGGQVGIGTAAPNNTLDVFNASKPALGFSAATDSTYKWTMGIDNSATGGGRFVIASSSDLGTNNRFVIDGGGRIGIGTSTPNNLLDLHSLTNPAIGFSGAAGADYKWTMGVDVATGKFKISSSSALGTNDRFVIDGAGNIGIGTASPNSSLEIARTDASTALTISRSGTSVFTMGMSNFNTNFSSTNDFRFSAGTATDAVTIKDNTGNLGIGTTTPYARLSVNSFNGGTTPQLVVASSTGAGATTTHFIVDSSGNIGIGTAAPQGNLEVVASSGNATAYINAPDDDDAVLTLQAATTEYTQIIHDGAANIAYFRNRTTDGDMYLGVTDTSLGLHYPIRIYNNNLAFNDAGVDYDMRFEGTSDANLLYLDAGTSRIGIGSSTPLAKLTASSTSGITAIFDQRGTSDILQLQDAGSTVFVVRDGGNVGIGTTTPSGRLHVVDSSVTNTALFERNGATTDAIWQAARVLSTKTTDMGDGFGTALTFNIQDTAGVINTIATVGAVRSGSDTTGDLVFETYNAGTRAEKLRVTAGGNIGIGTTTPGSLLTLLGNGADAITTFTASTSNSGVFYNWSVGSDVSDGGKFKISSSTALGTSDRLVIDGSGNVGIGTATPSSILHLNNGNTTSYPTITVSNGYTGLWDPANVISELSFRTEDNSGIGARQVGMIQMINDMTTQQTTMSGAMAFYVSAFNTAATEKMRISSAGNVGIGTTSPSTKLEIDTDSNTSGLRLLGAAETTEIADIYLTAGGALKISTANTGGSAAFIDIDPNDNGFGMILRDSGAGTGSTAYTNFYMNDATTDYLNIVVGAANTGTGLVINADDKVGIGTTTPFGMLSVDAPAGSPSFVIGSSSATHLFVDPSGNIAIGTTTIRGKFHVLGGVGVPLSNGFSLNPTIGGNRTLSIDGNKLDVLYSNAGTSASGPSAGLLLMTGTAAANVGVGSTTPVAKLTVTNTGTQPSFIVEDSTGPDSTPFIIDDSGNVGIGTSSPSSIFAMAKAFSSTESAITIQQTAAQASHQAINWMAYTGNSLGAIKLNSDTLSSFQTSLSFETNTGSVATEKMRILANGNVGIGTTTPFAKLSVNPVAGDSRASFVVGSSTKTNFTIMNDGRVGIGTSSPQGLLDITSVSAGSSIYLNGANANYKELYFQTGGVAHWRMGQDDDTESGSNAGGDFYLNAFGDTGSYIASPLWIKRSTGFVGIATTTPFAQLSVQNITSSNSFAVNDVINDSTPFVIDASGNVGIQKLVPATALDVLGTASSSALVVNGTTAIRGVTYTWPTANASGVLTNNGSGTLSWGSAGGVNSGTANYLAYYDTSSTVGSSAIFVSSTLSTLNVAHINRSLVTAAASTTYISSGYTYPGFGNVAGTVGGTVYLAKGGDATTFLGDAAGGAGGTVYIATGGDEGGEGGAGAGGTVYLARGGALDAGITEAADGAVYIGNAGSALLQVSGSIVVTTGRINSVDADNAAADNTYISSGSTSVAAATTYISVGGDDGGTNGNGGTAGNVYIAKGGDSGGASGNSGNAGDVFIAGSGEAADVAGNDGDVTIGTSWSANGTTTIYGTFLLPTTYNKTVGGTNRDLYIDNTGKVGYLSSALKYKDNVADMNDTSWLYDLHAVNFTYKGDASSTPQYGFIAEEVEAVNPDFVFYNNQGELEGVQYGALISPVINELQNLKSRLDGFAGASLRVSTSSPTGMPSSGALSVIENPELTVATLKVETAAVFSGTIYVYGEAGFLSKVTFENDVIVKGKIIVDVDTAGTIMIPRNGTSTKITFEEPYEVMPRIVATLQTLTDVKYAIIDKSLESFTIAIIGEAEDDIYFDWIALAAEDREDASIIPPLPTIVIESSPTPGVSVSDIINSGSGAVLGESESTGDPAQGDAGTGTADGTTPGDTSGAAGDSGTGSTGGSDPASGDTGSTGSAGTTESDSSAGGTSAGSTTGSSESGSGSTSDGSGSTNGGTDSSGSTSTSGTSSTSGGSSTGSTSGTSGGSGSTGGDSGSSGAASGTSSGTSSGGDSGSSGGSGSSSGGDGSASGA